MKSIQKTAIASTVAILLSAPASQAEIKNINISGVVEAEISSLSSDANGDSSDIAVPTVEFGIEASLSEKVDVSVVLLAEDVGTDDQTSMEVDEAIINMTNGNRTLTVGQTGVPFGAYETGVLSDPLTTSLGETAETLVMYSMDNESGLSLAGYLFNGDVDDSDDEINDIGLSLAMSQENWAAGADWISNLGDSDTLGDLTNPAQNDDVAGLALHAMFSTGNLTFIAEHVMAMDEFSAGDAAGLEPSATHLEIGMDLGDDNSVALSLSSSDDADGLLDYETQTAIAYNTMVMEQVGMAIEFVTAEEYSGDEDSAVTVQLAAEF